MKRIIIITIAVAVAIAAAIVPVSAYGVDISKLEYLITDSFGNIILSNEPLYMLPQDRTTNTYLYYITLASEQYTDRVILMPHYYDGSVVYEVAYLNDYNACDFNYYSTEFEFTNQSKIMFHNNKKYLGYIYRVFRYYYWVPDSGTYISHNIDTLSQRVTELKITANYTPLFTYYGQELDLSFTSDLINYDSSLKLEDVVAPGITIDGLTQIINECINNQTSTIINYGDQYIQFLPTDKAAALEQTQNQLSQSENAVKDKSQSLQQKVSNQWSTNISTTKNFVNTVAPATAAVTSTVTNIVSVMPEEVQALLVAIPMIIFIGWIIGRIGGG